MRDHENGFLAGLLVGLAIGGILAILYAPERGDKTRKRLVKKSGQWQEKASGALDTAGEIVDRSRKKMGI
ncbi:MAG: YtxH domain-containing protein [Gemmatimonadota bacterium]